MRFASDIRCRILAGLLAGAAMHASAEKPAKTTPVPAPASAPAPTSQEREIQPPFSLMWHEPSERLELKIEAAKLSITDRRKLERQWIVTAGGFKKPNSTDASAPKPPELRRVLFHFDGGAVSKEKGANGKVREVLAGGQLVEVELQYQQDGWDEERYGTCLSEKRQMLDRLYGPGQQLVRSSTPTPDGKATQTIVGYKWNRNNTAVELIYFHVGVNDGEQAFHTLSLHYKRS
ncbi:hypothetical protein LBMAG57_00340 [Verrucomicrobiota bacterium]|jgi:hypothetical protein|nr:hypothetical protein LBMAG57_00340 [Verrucomicrobiota bacterium]